MSKNNDPHNDPDYSTFATNDLTTPFDNMVGNKRVPSGIARAAICIVDTLKLAWLVTHDVFGDKATPELAIQVNDRIMTKIMIDVENSGNCVLEQLISNIESEECSDETFKDMVLESLNNLRPEDLHLPED